ARVVRGKPRSQLRQQRSEIRGVQWLGASNAKLALDRRTIRPGEHGDARATFAAQHEVVDERRERLQEGAAELSAAHPGAAAELELFREPAGEREPLLWAHRIVEDGQIAHAIEALLVA